MVIASELRPGMVIRSEGQVYKVLEAESKAGAAKMGGVVKASLSNVHSGRMLDQHFRPAERVEDLELERLAWSSISSNIKRPAICQSIWQIGLTRQGQSRAHTPGIFIPAMRRAKLGLPMVLNILRIWAYWRRSWLTS